MFVLIVDKNHERLLLGGEFSFPTLREKVTFLPILGAVSYPESFPLSSWEFSLPLRRVVQKTPKQGDFVSLFGSFP